MPKRKLIITHNINQEYIDQINDLLPEWSVITGKDPEIWQDHVEDAEIIAGWKKGIEERLAKNTSLRWIQTWSAGIDNLPQKELESRNILISSANGVHAFPISETIFGLMLAFTRKIHTYIRNQSSRTWHHANMNLEIHQKTIGIIGVGAIGRETARIAKAFGMKVLGVRHSGRPEEYVDEMYTSEEMHSILPRCDYVVVTLPLTKETHHLFGAEEFKLMKPNTFFINIGRGETVVEEDLIKALTEGRIAGAGLDVFETEPLQTESPLWELENVIITPHTAGATEYYNQRVIEDILIPNLQEYIGENKPSINLVDYKKGY
ncbi:D-2-hydroxyacid dehydrogenase [Peribacillus cavernae]|uniref:D-2-hydroxyacid dehydrogenase n=1 Tax=Peribacillus cavernae TaxID=1674310 RepID=A0A3S0UGB2_9BACI|nr:D-2-hydroxyacid dehydrogenase [Peribacillus cavernae]MDQ0218791.1 phosphoglycerate dehydrogenase-like enzyme [Peribacillus cavernae]RUQ31001.1 D-2-hydroxyacid dehydrogenase [Peribacillus cavernae]